MPLTNEYYTGSAGSPGYYGLGQRVPMTVISPWSTGGWVCSETFDHTSIIRFMETRFGVREPQITPWRRAVCGDLTSAFDFSTAEQPRLHLPSTRAYRPKDNDRHPDYDPVPPANPRVPTQEGGVRPSRALGYDVEVRPDVAASTLRFLLANRGTLGAHLQARSPSAPPRGYTLGRGRSLSPSWAHTGDYDVSFHGPNGFFRRFAGTTHARSVEATLVYPADGTAVAIANSGPAPALVTVADVYGHESTISVRANRTERVHLDPSSNGGWYDVTVTGPDGLIRQLAGRIETGRPSISDPQLGG